MQVLRYIGKKTEMFVPGQVYNMQTQYMCGKIYESPKDKVGKRDPRIMAWINNTKEPNLKVYENEDAFYKDFERVSAKTDGAVSMRSFI
jgi:hypothetical protein